MLQYIVFGILFVDTADTKIKAGNALNAMFVETVDTTVKTHFQCTTSFRKLRLEAFQSYH